MPPNGRASKACSICHQKKIKCNYTENNQPCTNCRLGDYTCRPHQRKRKHYSLSPSPAPRDANTKRQTLDITSFSGSDSASVGAATNVDGQLVQQEDIVAPPLSPRSQNNKAFDVPTTEQSYVGRSEYLDGQIPFSEDNAMPQTQKDSLRETSLPDVDLHFLASKKALDLPPRPVREPLIDAYMERCQPWMPIVERRWLEESPQRQLSLLLLQAVFLAGSRVSSSLIVHTTSSEFYERARALFLQGHEKNTTLAIVAVCLLQWWNPTGPESFSTNTSGFWVRIGVELAYQVGLHKEPAEGPFRSFRRRLWWTLATRDSIISVGTGRPRTINLADSNMAQPSLDDFPVENTHAHLFIAYVSICKQMGDIAEAQRRRSLTPASMQLLENSLFRWLKELPRTLQISHRQDEQSWALAPYNFEARQLAIPYFISLILLHRSSNPKTSVSTVCLIASSYVVNIFEEFVSRDQLRYLGPVFAFYALAAGLVQLAGFRYEALSSIAEHEFNVVRVTLTELGKRWGSAHGALRALTRAKSAIQQQPRLQGLPSALVPSTEIFFNDFGHELCRMWHVGFDKSNGRGRNDTLARAHPERWESVNTPTRNHAPSNLESSRLVDGSSTMNNDGFADGYGWGIENIGVFDDPLAVAEGSWLFEDFDLQSVLSGNYNAAQDMV